jgi:hypothetical protein
MKKIQFSIFLNKNYLACGVLSQNSNIISKLSYYTCFMAEDINGI